MVITAEEIRELKERLRVINSYHFEDIEFYEDEKRIEVSKEQIQNWKYVGLNNVDFITSGAYKETT